MDHRDLWNNLPIEERKRLMPHMIEMHILHLEQCKVKAVRHHTNHMRELNNLIKDLKKDLLQNNY